MGQPYREPAPSRPDPFLRAWSRLRWRRLGLRTGAVAYFALVATSIALSTAPWEARIVAIALGLTIAASASLVILSVLPPFLCPACERPFFPSAASELGRRRPCSCCGIAAGTPFGANTPVPWARLAGKKAGAAPVLRAFLWLVATVVTALLGYLLVSARPA